MRAVVVGGGLAGLVAARELAIGGAEVTLVESSNTLGGQIHTREGWGDVGAEAFLVRRPEALALCADLGLSGEIVRPSTVAQPHVVLASGLAALPKGTYLGIPKQLAQLRGVISPWGIARAAADFVMPASTGATVGALSRRRLGSEVVDTMIDPLLGGVYAGSCDDFDLAATMPALLTTSGPSLIRRARQVPSGGDGPVFSTLRGGLSTLVEALSTDLAARGVTVVLGAQVSSVTGTPGAWSVDDHRADAVIVAVNAQQSARLLEDAAPQAAQLAAVTPYASVAVVSLRWSRATAGRLADDSVSGWLVPRARHRLVKAVTVLTSKWPHLRERWPDDVVVRASVGRYGNDDALGADTWMTGVAAAEVSAVAGVHGALLDSVVTRWAPSLPQYLEGHPHRVKAVRDALPEGIAVAGAAWDGVGLPAIIASAKRAVARVGQ